MLKNQRLRLIAGMLETNMRIVLFITAASVMVGCRNEEKKGMDLKSDADPVGYSSVRHDVIHNENGESQTDASLQLKFESRDTFLLSWKNGSVVSWLDGKSEESNYKSIFDYIDTNIMIYGIENWSIIPDSENNQSPPMMESRDYQLMKALRDTAYSRLHREEALAVIQEADGIRETSGNHKYEALRRLRNRYLKCAQKKMNSDTND